MKFIYKGRYKEEAQLPVREHPEGYVAFREPPNLSRFALLANLLSLVILAAAVIPCILRGKAAFRDLSDFMERGYIRFFIGLVLSLVCSVPHEFLHALCFKDEVMMFTNLRKGILFVVGTEDMSRGRFIFMSLLPSIVFGFIPYILYLIFPQATMLAGLGVFAVAAGAGDYINVYNCLTQVPRGAKVYMSGTRSYWNRP